MNGRFLGLPLYAWGALCLLVALVFVVVAPGQQLAVSAGLRHALLRWGHPLVWALLGCSCFARGAGLPGPGNLLALAAGLLYVAFLAALLRG